ncbi:RNA-directed DNA polymerase from mobile element jockey, partial [Exaiptasia diaphana]
SIIEDDSLLSEIVEAINTTLKEGEIPEDWRDCNLSVIPKPHKDHRLLKGYRVITMANVLVKLCEKIAARRIVDFLERNNKLPTSVGGARPKRSTTSNVEALLHIMQEGLQNMNCYAIGLFDLEDAYNRVHIPTLADKMIGFGISEVMTRWVLSMLDERRCHMRFGNWKSDAFKVSSGLPQGSPLSCVLFNIYTADIISWTKDEETDPFSYVDDIIISCVSESPVKAVEQLQIASDQWCCTKDIW